MAFDFSQLASLFGSNSGNGGWQERMYQIASTTEGITGALNNYLNYNRPVNVLDNYVYGSENADPLTRLGMDLTGANLDTSAITNNINRNTNYTDNNSLLERYNNINWFKPYNVNYDNIPLGFISAGFLKRDQNGKMKFSLDNAHAAIQGSRMGMDIGGKNQYAAAIGAGIGGTANIVSQLLEPSRMKTANGYFNYANNTNQLAYNQSVNNSKNKQMQNAMINLAALGGPLETHGANFNNNITEINEGGKHEQNPYGGIPVSIAEDGKPNLVEEGEVIFKNNLVLSDRMKISSPLKKFYGKLNDDSPASYAKNSDTAKEAKERMNDPLSTKAYDKMLATLYMDQEQQKAEEQQKQQANYAALGGYLHALGYSLDKPPYSSLSEYLDNDLYSNDDVVYTKSGPFNISEPDNTKQVFIKNGPLDIDIPTDKIAISNPVINNEVKSVKSNTSSTSPYSTFGRKTALAADLATLINNLRRPDYSDIDKIDREINAINPYEGYNPLGNYMAYNPIDINSALARIDANEAANRRAIINNSNGNRALANASLAALDYNSNNAIGDLALKAQLQNEALKQQVAAFNYDIDKANSAMDMQSKQNRLHAQQLRTAGRSTTTQMRNQLDMVRNNALSQALSGLTADIMGIGRENFIFNQLQNAGYRYNYNASKDGSIAFTNANGDTVFLDEAGNVTTPTKTAACSGKLRTKKK